MTSVLAGVAISLLAITPASARGGGGGHGGGGHSSGGGGHSSSSGHSSGGHYSGGHTSVPHSSGHVAPHYSGPSAAHGGAVGGVHGSSPMHGPVVGGYRHGYVGGGRGAYIAGGRVPYFHGGPHGRLWWGPHYGWRVPMYWGGYYYPYGVYLGVSYWVTDYIMLDYLAAEEARMMAYGGPGAVAVPVTSASIDGGVREELRAQIAEILAMPAMPVGSATAPGNTLVVNDPRIVRALAASHHVFVVSRSALVTDRTNGGTCNLTQGDLVRSAAPIPSGQAYADVTVAASKKASCSPGVTVALPIADLVHFEEALIERVARGAAAAKATDSETEAETTPNAPAPNAPAGVPNAAPPPHGLSAPPPPSPGGLSI